ncbi:hypothetical protein GGD81_004772 [Rhodobium orientis]|uniref:THIF-type NAD/FAD binding fold domain-containing protein n=1 Tax=Rhodobium orientis TaxID=34017 RepID=A0A327JDQ1_9HYPH|nr:ThiF family adenylyltransferase [Rhodobium orientis]MBB4305690.1 hypothetical protein [Rhodobium orientis]MBK5948419.1 hypothetical protein [Rhodobium orientis]RAI24607.1 hypothetical protein CH339_21950 [Rhodobium orientis]
MDSNEWLKRWNDRTLRYAHRCLDPAHPIAISCDRERLSRFDTQIALLSATNLFGRMSPNVVLAFEDAPINAALPWPGTSLHTHILSGMRAANPFGTYQARDLSPMDFRIHIGRGHEGFVVDGTGWNAYVGPGPSPLPEQRDGNGFGAALAVVVAAAQLFRNPFNQITKPFIGNALDWSDTVTHHEHDFVHAPDIGRIHFIGLGSVGSAALYYLGLATRSFIPTLIDMDRIKIHNLTRSPIFIAADCVDETKYPEGGVYKVAAARRFLNEIGISDVVSDPAALHQSVYWREREAGTPDIVVSAANEHDVRYHIEMGYPPVQVYATTGKNWQVALLRHHPGDDACSMCVFPPERSKIPMACATDHVTVPETGEQIDAALPFLSFGAGLMTAAEIVKLALPGFPFSRARVNLNLRTDPIMTATPIPHRTGCTCEQRNKAVHLQMFTGSRYA